MICYVFLKTASENVNDIRSPAGAPYCEKVIRAIRLLVYFIISSDVITTEILVKLES